LLLLELGQEVTGGVTNYVARLPEAANSVQDWKASLESKQEITGGVQHFVARLPEVAENSQSWLASVQDKPLLEAKSSTH
jgi:hypothetical protein